MDENIIESVVPPPLSSSISTYYSSLSIESRKAFNKVFMLMWNTLMPNRRRYGLLYSYHCLESIRLRYHLSSADLSLLTYLCMVSNRGKHILNSQYLEADPNLPMKVFLFRQKMIKFKEAGYIVRLSRDPSQPYLLRSISRQKIFIQVTGKCVALFDKIEKEIFNSVVNTSYYNVTTMQ